jgi:uncharacterized cupredoxin-like copper-binding protein
MHKNHEKHGEGRGWLCLSLLLSIVLPGLLVGCSNGAGTAQQKQPARSLPISPSVQTITITALDYTYDMPGSFALHAGLVDVRLVNNGTQPHQAQFARLNSGVTSAQVGEELITKRKEAEAYALFTFLGGPDTISPGDGQEALLDLSAGEYALMCLVTGSDGLPHIDKGMIHFLMVSAAKATQPAPQTKGEVVIQDHQYMLPRVLTQSGKWTVKVENQGTEPHELNIVRLASGKGAPDVLAFFRNPSGPPPFEEFGGMATLAPGTSGWITVHLEPGRYTALSAIPDPKTGVFQLTQGLLAMFTVQ